MSHHYGVPTSRSPLGDAHLDFTDRMLSPSREIRASRSLHGRMSSNRPMQLAPPSTIDGVWKVVTAVMDVGSNWIGISRVEEGVS